MEFEMQVRWRLSLELSAQEFTRLQDIFGDYVQFMGRDVVTPENIEKVNLARALHERLTT